MPRVLEEPKSTSKPSVVFLMNSWPAKTGGEIYAFEMFKYAVSHLANIDSLSVENDRNEIRTQLCSWMPWLPSKVNSIIRALLLAWKYRHLQGLVVQDQEYSTCLSSFNAWRCLWQRGPLITIVHHLPFYESTKHTFRNNCYRWKYRTTLSFSSHLVAVSRYTFAELISLGFNPLQITILTPGLDRSKLRISPQSWSNKKNNIVSVGRISQRKGILALIEAFELLNDSQAHLHLVGATDWEPEYYQQVRSRMESSPRKDQIHITGKVDAETYNRILSEADIFVSASLQEGFGIVLLEAMYFSLPIIATNQGATPELVDQGVNGLLVPPNDVKALAAALKLLVENPDLRRKLGEGGSNKIFNNYNWITTGERFYKLISRFQNEPLTGNLKE